MPQDPSWSPDGKSFAYGGAPVNMEHSIKSEIRVFDLQTKESKTIPGSQGMYSPRWSPDGHYLAAISDGMSELWLYNFERDHWQELPLPLVSEGVGWPAWSHDGRYLYYMSDSRVYRASIPDGKPELIADARSLDIECPVFLWGSWFDLTPDDRVLMLADREVEEIYALDLEYR